MLGVIGAFFAVILSLRLMGGPFAGLVLLPLAITIGQLVVIYGLWTVQPWGWTWGIVIYALSAVLNLIGGEVFSFLINLVIIAYLFTKQDYYHA